MARPHTPTILVAALVCFATPAAAQQPTGVLPAPRVVGAAGPGLQPQFTTGPYQRPATGSAARGVNPFAGPVAFPSYTPVARFGPRPAQAPVVFAPPPAPGVPNNPAVFNPGVAPPFPLLIPPPIVPVPGVAFNPVFVSRRGVVSAYYVAPATIRSHGSPPYPGDELPSLAGPEVGYPHSAGSAFFSPPGEYRFLPWIW
jgi:hypothetical protein